MNIEECRELLLREGCNPDLYSIGNSKSANNAFCLEKKAGKWIVFYAERGLRGEPIYSSGSESAASQFFYEYIKAMRHQHCVGFFSAEKNSLNFQKQLAAQQIEYSSDMIPYGGADSFRYRVFVCGKAIFQVQAIFEALPVED